MGVSDECIVTHDDEYYCDNLDSAFDTIMEYTNMNYNNWTLIIDTRSYATSTQLNIDYSIVENSESFSVCGINNAQDTILVNKISCCSTTLFYAYIDGINYQLPDVFLQFKDFTYVSQYGLYQPFGYFYYVYRVSFSNVIFDLSNSGYNYSYDKNSDNNLVELYLTSNLVVENVQFYGVHVAIGSDESMYLFDSEQGDSVCMKNVLVSGSNNDDNVNNTVSFGKFVEMGAFYFENITIVNHVVSDAFYFVGNVGSNIRLANIIIDNVFGTGAFFTFSHSWDVSVSMTNIYANGNGKTISNRLMSNSYNYGSRFVIDSSIFTDFLFNGASLYLSAIPFYFGLVHYGSRISFYNVTFSNLTTLDDDNYGLIYIDDDVEIEIIDCVFKNNVGFIGLIRCATGSSCVVTIENSVFINNSHSYDSINSSSSSLCYDGLPVIYSIYLETGANSTLVMRQNTFYFYSPTVIYDSSSSVTISDNEIVNQVGSDKYHCRDSDSLVGFFDGNFELIVIVLVLVCIIVCVCIVIRLMKTKNEHATNIEQEFDENLANNLSGNHTRGEVEIPQAEVPTVASLKPQSSNSVGFGNTNGDTVDTQVVLDDGKEADNQE